MGYTVTKTTRLWEGVRKAKETNKDFNLKKTFALIREVIPEGSPTGRFIDARRDLYTTFPIEEYSLPYGMDTLESVIRESLG